jgi:hypothetical protein
MQTLPGPGRNLISQFGSWDVREGRCHLMLGRRGSRSFVLLHQPPCALRLRQGRCGKITEKPGNFEPRILLYFPPISLSPILVLSPLLEMDTIAMQQAKFRRNTLAEKDVYHSVR